MNNARQTGDAHENRPRPLPDATPLRSHVGHLLRRGNKVWERTGRICATTFRLTTLDARHFALEDQLDVAVLRRRLEDRKARFQARARPFAVVKRRNIVIQSRDELL